MRKNPKVSFVIRTLNEERFIGKVLRYVYQQTFKDFEVVIVDSGSTDKTLKIVKKFPVKLIQIKPKEFGFSYALNLGISKTKSKYICIISGHSIPVSDTWLDDGMKYFKDDEVAAVTGYYTSVPVGYFSRKLGKLFFSPHQKKHQQYCRWLTNTNAIIRKDLWRKYPFDEKLPECEDYDWAKEMLARGYKVIKDQTFNVFHTHMLISKPSYRQRIPRWRKICKRIDKRKRPRKSHTKVKVN